MQPASAAGGSDAAFTANSAGNDEDPALRASSAAHGAHGRCSMACTSGHTRPATAAAAATPPPLLLQQLPLQPTLAQLKLQSKLNHGLPPPDSNTNLRPITAGQSWV